MSLDCYSVVFFMRKYQYEKVYAKLLTPEIVSLLTQIHEHKGETSQVQEQPLTHLIETASIQSDDTLSNFTFLLSDPKFAPFTEVAIAAEKILHIDPAASILNCRRAMEFAVKWMYSVDKELEMPYQDNLQSLMGREEFREIVGQDICQRMDFIRIKGNHAAHCTGKKITEEQAMLCLENLHIFLDFVAYCYAEEYSETTFDPKLVSAAAPAPAQPPKDERLELDLKRLMEENAALKEQLTARRTEQQRTYVPKPLDISEKEASNKELTQGPKASKIEA